LALPRLFSAAMLGNTGLLRGFESECAPVGRHQRFGHPTIPTQRALGEVLGREMPQIFGNLLRLRAQPPPLRGDRAGLFIDLREELE
jgi:hypothetical protein